VISGGSADRITSFVDHPLEIDLQKPFTFLAWCYPSDTSDVRTIFAFESPMCHCSLLCVLLVPGSDRIYFGYMLNMQRRIHNLTKVHVPGSAWFHFAFVLLNSSMVNLYVNGVQQPVEKLEAPIFNPSRVEYPLYLCSCIVDVHHHRSELCWDKICLMVT
jgi:hypothetical protein